MDGSEIVGSPEWWFDRLMAGFSARKPAPWRPMDSNPDSLVNDTRADRLERLWAYHVGRAPLPEVADGYTEVFRAVMRKARSNYAAMCVAAMLHRMKLTSVATGVDSTGDDDLFAEIAEVSNWEAMVSDLFTFLFVMSESYGMVVPPKNGGAPMITAMDPRICIGDINPANPQVLRAALVRSFDDMFGTETAVLFLPGKAFHARRQSVGALGQPLMGKWEWDSERGGEAGEDVPNIDDWGGIPVVRLDNANGLGEFESHLDLLDRINDTTLQRIVIAWYQSFRQRAVKGDLEGDTDDAEPMTLEEFRNMFSADPGALWKVPAGVEFWESQQADFGPILNAKRDDVKEFAAVTFTPLNLITPDAANQSAEGASLVREGINHKVGDRRARVTPKLKMLLRMAFAMAGEPERGSKIKLNWGPLENNSLADKGSATAQVKGVLSLRSILIDIWGMSPQEAEDNITQLSAEQLLAVTTALAGQNRTPQNAGAQAPEPVAV